MRGFLALLDWEWRSHRAIVAVMAASILGLSLLFRSFVASAGYWNEPALVAVPTMWVLFTGGLAADVVGCEFTGRRIETLALLPASLLKVWTSKAVFVLAILAAFLAWTLVSQLLTYATFDMNSPSPDFERFFECMGQAAAFVLPLGAMTLFVATVVQRTLPALFLGAMATAAVCAGLDFLVRYVEPAVYHSGWGMVVMWQGVGLAFAVAAVATFVKGRVHTDDTWLRWRVAGSAVGRLFLLLSLFVGWEYWTWKQLAPGDPDALVFAITTSPDDKWVAIGAVKAANEELRSFGAARVWTVPVESGRPLLEVGRDRLFDTRSAWGADGTLQLCGVGSQKTTYTQFNVDPATGDVRSTQDRDVNDRLALQADSSAGFPFWATPNASLHFTSFADGKFTRVIEWKGLTRTIVARSAFTITRRPGVVWYSPDNLRVLRLDVATGEETTLVESKRPLAGCYVSPDGLRIIVTADDRLRVIGADTGAELGGKWPREVTWPQGARGSRFVVSYAYGESPQTLHDLSTGRTFDLGDFTPLKQAVGPEIQELADGRVVAMLVTGRVVLLDASLNVIHWLYPPGADSR